ncbi:MAG: DUF2157 domain-containing protein [Akkermansia sp.]|nr:DUF2157 domain-containing protein [Akkermansia sp.]
MKRSDIDKILAARLISPAQRDAIVEHFNLNEGKGMRWLLICLSILAAGLIVAGVVMLVSANWYTIPALVKMLVAMLLMAGFWLAWAKQREVHPITAEVLGFCGGGMWLACIALYGQIFQLQNPFVEGCTLFFAGIVFIPFICRQRFLIWAVVLVSFVELVVLGHGRASYLQFENWIPGWRDDYMYNALPLLVAVWWAVAERWNTASERWNSYKWIAPAMLLVGMSVAQAMMYDNLPPESLDVTSCVIMAVVPVVLFALKPRDVAWMPWCGVSAILSLVQPCLFLMGLVEQSDVIGYRFEPFVGILIYFLMALLMMFCGVRALRMSWINVGTLMVVYTAIALVADVLDSYTFSGLVLVVAGLLLLGLGLLLEKSRRRLIRAVKNIQPSSSQV